MIEVSTETDYDAKLKRLQDMEGSTHVQHLIVEFAALCVGCLCGWLFLGLWELPIWFCVTYSLLLTDRWLLFCDSVYTAKKRYFRHLALSFVSASSGSFLPVFLWFQGEVVYQFVALLYLAGAILNTFLVRSMSWPLMICFLIPNSVVPMLIAISFFWSNANILEASLTLLATVLLLIYVASAVVESVRQHRAHHVTQKRLEVSQKFEALGILCAGIAHDFNNLLGVISGNLELLGDDAASQKSKKLISSGLRAIDRAAALTDQLQHFGGASQLRNSRIDIKTIMDEVTDPLERLLPNDIQLSIEVAEEPAEISVDKQIFQAALQNLTMNARDSIKGFGSIKIVTKNWKATQPFNGLLQNELKTQNYLLISVTDSGAGISANAQARIFDPYFSSKKTSNVSGLGLGLSMVLGFIKQTDGDLRIHSEVGKGTTIDILLPRVSLENSNLPGIPPISRQEAQGATQFEGRQIHLLIVEDEPQLLSVLSERLEDQGYRVSTAVSGDDALKYLTGQANIDVVLTDVVMPGKIQGFALIEIIAKEFTRVKFIVISGYFPPTFTLPEATRARTTFLKKPVSLSDLSDNISELVNFKCD